MQTLHDAYLINRFEDAGEWQADRGPICRWHAESRPPPPAILSTSLQGACAFPPPPRFTDGPN